MNSEEYSSNQSLAIKKWLKRSYITKERQLDQRSFFLFLIYFNFTFSWLLLFSFLASLSLFQTFFLLLFKAGYVNSGFHHSIRVKRDRVNAQTY